MNANDGRMLHLAVLLDQATHILMSYSFMYMKPKLVAAQFNQGYSKAYVNKEKFKNFIPHQKSPKVKIKSFKFKRINF